MTKCNDTVKKSSKSKSVTKPPKKCKKKSVKEIEKQLASAERLLESHELRALQGIGTRLPEFCFDVLRANVSSLKRELSSLKRELKNGMSDAEMEWWWTSTEQKIKHT